MFLEFIALFFLALFLIKLMNPKVIPYIKQFWTILKSVVVTSFFLFLNSIILGINLLIKRTVYVVGIILIPTLLFSLLLSLITHDYQFIFSVFWSNFIEIYVTFFFNGIIILGMIEVILKKETVKSKMANKFYTEFNKFQYTNVTEPKAAPRAKPDETFVYDEETKKYRYDK